MKRSFAPKRNINTIGLPIGGNAGGEAAGALRAEPATRAEPARGPDDIVAPARSSPRNDRTTQGSHQCEREEFAVRPVPARGHAESGLPGRGTRDPRIAQRPAEYPAVVRGPHPIRRRHGPTTSGYTPSQIQQAYQFNQVSDNGSGETIAIVDAYNDPNIQSDLATFDGAYGLPAPPSFTVVNQTGGRRTSRPPTAAGESRSRSTSNGPTPWRPGRISSWSRPARPPIATCSRPCRMPPRMPRSCR